MTLIGHVGIVFLNRAERKNALGRQMVDELNEALCHLKESK